jgi:hypothetical protein
MSAVAEIENAIRELPADDLARFRAWFAEYDAEKWDQKFEADVQSGRLDRLADEARQNLRDGRCTDR